MSPWVFLDLSWMIVVVGLLLLKFLILRYRFRRPWVLFPLHLVLLLHLRQQVQHEALVEVEDQQSVCNAEAVLSREARQLPVGVTEWVLEEPGDVFVDSPSLGPVSRLVGLLNHLGKVAISLLGKGSEISEKYYLPADHVSSLHHIRVTVEETFDTCAPRLQR